MDSSFGAASPALVQDRIYAFIKDAITSVQFKPGQRLRTDQLAQAADASRTPVREALSRLAQEGLVERDDGWGYIVRQVGVKDVLELFSVREALELEAAREVIPMLTPAIIAELTALNRKAEALFAARQYEAFLSQNRTFHKALARATGNALLQQMLDMIHDRVRQVGALTVRLYEPRAKELLLENRRIMAAIRKRDAAVLLNAVSDHIKRGRDHVLRLIAAPADRSMALVPAPAQKDRLPGVRKKKSKLKSASK